MRSRVCLNDFGSDIALTLMLRSWELKCFLLLLDFASTGRDPRVIPASRRGRLRLAMRLGRDEEKFAKRLDAFAGEADLIELRADGGIFIKYLDDQMEAEWREAGGDEEDDDLARADPPPNGTYALSGAQAGPSYSNGYHAARQPNRRYSDSPEAIKKREQRQGGRRQGDPQGQNSLGQGFQGGVAENVPTNVPRNESKRPDVGRRMSPEMSPDAADISGTSSRVSPNVNVSGEREEIDSLDSGDVNVNVADKQMSRQMSPAQMSQPPMSPRPPSGSAPAAPAAPPARPPVRPGFEAVDTRARMMRDVDEMIRLTHDAKSRGFYISAWKHCNENGSLACWDMAGEILAEQARTGPPPGQPDHLPRERYGAFLTTTLTNLLRDNGTPYPQGTAAERDDARSQIQAGLNEGAGGETGRTGRSQSTYPTTHPQTEEEQ